MDSTILESAIQRLRDIAALAATTKRRQAGCELAQNWLWAHGYANEPGGYVPGVGFEDGAPALAPKPPEEKST